jgi:hypothetical protein
VQFSSDDVADNSFSLAANKLRPFFVLDQRGVARIDESFSFDPTFDRYMQTRYQLGVEIADHSRAYQLARQVPDLLRISQAHAAPPADVLRPPKDRVWAEAWSVTEAILARMNDFARRNGARMALVVVPHPLQHGRAYPEERLAALGGREGFPVVILADDISGEWTATSHGQAADLIARRSCTSALSDAPASAR